MVVSSHDVAVPERLANCTVRRRMRRPPTRITLADAMSTDEGCSSVLLADDFEEGLDLTGTWALTSIESFTADDGVVTISPGGLCVRASGTNPVTGEPAFTLAGAGELNHLKWMADTRHVSSNAYPGFDAVPGEVLRCTMSGSGQTFGTAAHPFGAAVRDAQSDLRLASFAMNVIDYETGMVFDTWQTNTRIYPYYERLEMSGPATYQRFSSIFPGVARSPDGEDKLSLAYDRSAGVVRWIINDREAARVDRIGFPSADATMLIDRGGTPQPAAPRQLNCGMALFTLMDGGQPPSGTGLVSLGGSYEIPSRFVEGPTLFGQGAELRVRKFEVRSGAAGSGDGAGG
jgi:hypothetical protein